MSNGNTWLEREIKEAGRFGDMAGRILTAAFHSATTAASAMRPSPNMIGNPHQGVFSSRLGPSPNHRTEIILFWADVEVLSEG